MKIFFLRSILALFIVLGGLTGCATDSADRGGTFDSRENGKTKGTFRGRWWSYYERGVSFGDGKDWKDAEADLREAVGKREADQRRARTYGMHFIDYFPHREMGVIFYNQGRYLEAVAELETSLRSEKSAKAEYYLDSSRKALIEAGGRDLHAPGIFIDSPANDILTNAFSYPVSGVAKDDTYVSRVEVNGTPIRVDLGAPEVPFRLDVPLKAGVNPIRIVARDLTGRTSVAERTIRVDRTGPVLSLDEPGQGWSLAGKVMRLKGYVYDDSGLGEVKVNGTRVAVFGDGEVKLDQTITMGDETKPITIEARDRAGNETRAELRPGIGHSGLPRQVRLASLVMPLLAAAQDGRGADGGPSEPAIELRHWTSDQSVFLDQTYIEGSVQDEAGVRQLQINGQSILRRAGKKVYFAHLTDLREGENVFLIEATSVSGGRSRKEVHITRKIQKVRQVGSRLSMALLPMERMGVPGPGGDALEEMLLAALVERGRFVMLERRRLDEILQEQKLSRKKLADPETAVREGKIMSAGCVLLGSVVEKQGSVEVYARVVDTETARILATVDVYGQDPDPDAMRELCRGLVIKLSDELPLVDGLVVQVKGNRVLTDLGAETRIKKGMRLLIYQDAEPVTHPVTGADLGEDTEQIGQAMVQEIYDKRSDAEILDKSAKDRVKPMQKVITQ
jgi:hypothetical protein